MPKLKTYKAAAKRLQVACRGTLLRRKEGRSYLSRQKSKRTLRSYRKDLPVAQEDRRRVRRLLGLKGRESR